MEFDWTTRTVKEWRTFFEEVPRYNVLQSMPHARALRLLDQKVTRYALIKRGLEAVGIMAIQEIKLGPVHVVDLYRGPLWFEENPPAEWLAEFAELFNKTYPKRILRRRRWLPEWRGGADASKILESNGFKSTTQTYQTVWLDLAQTEADLRSQLKQKWRNALNKGERTNVSVKIDWTGSTSETFLRQYGVDLATRKYKGRNPKFIQQEIAAALHFREVAIAWAFHPNSEKIPVAAVLIFVHGRSGSYRSGWTTDVGRQCNAHNVLLWEVSKALKARGLRYFDLGGVEPSTAEGLTHFKHGMGGEEFQTPGVYK